MRKAHSLQTAKSPFCQSVSGLPRAELRIKSLKDASASSLNTAAKQCDGKSHRVEQLGKMLGSETAGIRDAYLQHATMVDQLGT